MPQLSDERRAILRAVCDTFVPSIEREHDPDGFWARAASHLGADAAIADVIATLPEDQAAGLGELLDVLEQQGFSTASQRSREQLLRTMALASREAAGGVAALRGLTMLITYAGVDPATGAPNPNWKTLGYPGPPQVPAGPSEPIEPLVPEEDLELEADVVVVGSGSGGGVMAGRLAEAGLRVVVLEAGAPFHEAESPGLEIWAWQNLYWRGGPTPTADGTLTLQAGATLGGGSVINWTNCLRPRPWVREDWAAHGLSDVDTPEFDAHVDAVWERLGVTDECSELNGPQQRMKEGADKLGWEFAFTTRNVDPSLHRPESAGHLGFGDRTAAKRSTAKTYLLDAVRHGAQVLCLTAAERILVEDGRAAGVEARYADVTTGATAKVTVRAPQVVVAAGALESPGLLLRSGIGGPAVGENLRLHPATATFGYYATDQEAWWGAPHAGIVEELHDTGDGYGCYLEGSQYTTGLAASALPFTTAETHKAAMEDFRFGATTVCHIRDRGAGRVTLDPNGMTQIEYPLSDELDRANTRRGMEASVRLHEAAGAQRIMTLAAGAPEWRRGDDLEAYLRRIAKLPVRAGGVTLFSAHQMGSCRMGEDPATSVADPRGELHDTPGVWIGDGSAFPTASGANPMISIMSLAHRTADHVVAAAAAAAVSVAQEATA